MNAVYMAYCPGDWNAQEHGSNVYLTSCMGLLAVLYPGRKQHVARHGASLDVYSFT